MVHVPGDYVSMDDNEGGSAGDGKKRRKGSRIRNILQRHLRSPDLQFVDNIQN